MVDQTGFTTNYTYNAMGLLSGLTDGSGDAIDSYTYDATGRLTKELKGNGTFTIYAYDLDGEIVSVVNDAPNGTANSSFVYTYDNLGLCTTETTLQGQWVYNYDASGQLTHAIFTSNAPSLLFEPGLAVFLRCGGEPDGDDRQRDHDYLHDQQSE